MLPTKYIAIVGVLTVASFETVTAAPVVQFLTPFLGLLAGLIARGALPPAARAAGQAGARAGARVANQFERAEHRSGEDEPVSIHQEAPAGRDDFREFDLSAEGRMGRAANGRVHFG